MNPETKSHEAVRITEEIAESSTLSEEVSCPQACYMKLIEEICSLKDKVGLKKMSSKKTKYKWVY